MARLADERKEGIRALLAVAHNDNDDEFDVEGLTKRDVGSVSLILSGSDSHFGSRGRLAFSKAVAVATLSDCFGLAPLSLCPAAGLMSHC